MRLIFIYHLFIFNFIFNELGAVPTIDVNDNIIGGERCPTISNIPHIVSLQNIDYKNDEIYQFCAGTIIHQKWILTAAHCLNIDDNAQDWSKLYVRAGSLNAFRNIGFGSQLVKVKNYIINPNWKKNSQNQNYDIALLELAEPLYFSNKVQKALIPSINIELKAGVLGMISGWGIQNISNPDDDCSNLYFAEVPIVERMKCYELYSNLKDDDFCVGEYKKTVCDGDSGGAFSISVNYKGQKYNVVYGIASFGYFLCNQPSAFTDVSYHKKWILQNTNGDLKEEDIYTP